MVALKDSRWHLKFRSSNNYLGGKNPIVYSWHSVCNDRNPRLQFIPLDNEITCTLLESKNEVFREVFKDYQLLIEEGCGVYWGNTTFSIKEKFPIDNFSIDDFSNRKINIIYKKEFNMTTAEPKFFPLNETKFYISRTSLGAGKFLTDSSGESLLIPFNGTTNSVEYYLNQYPDLVVYPNKNLQVSYEQLKNPTFRKAFVGRQFFIKTYNADTLFRDPNANIASSFERAGLFSYDHALSNMSASVATQGIAFLHLERCFPDFVPPYKSEPKKKDKNMSTEKLSTSSTSSFFDTMKKDMSNAGYRIAGDQMIRGIQGATLAGLSNKGMNSEKVEIAKELIESEVGMAAIRVGLGLILTHAPVDFIKNDPRMARLAEEFRISGFQTMGNVAFETILEYALPAIKAGMQHLPPLTEAEKEKFRVSTPTELPNVVTVPVEIPVVETAIPAKIATV